MPTMSGQLEKDPGERKLRVTLLSAEWKTSRNGDLTTINRELAIQMAKHPNVEVSVFLPQCSEEDKKSADSKYNVKLIEAVEVFGREPVDWLASVPEGHVMDCVVGHGVALGWQIQLIKKNPNYSHCKWIQVVHSAPEEIGMYKNISKGQQMQKQEIELCEKADQVVTTGPKLTEAYKHQLRKQDVFNLTPSIFSEFSDVQQASDERKTFCVLVIESGDNEDFDPKGYEIAAKAIANLQDKSYQLKFASKQRGKEDEIKDKLLQCICEADIALLPSRTEGFGLSALQAISAGLPLLVSENSGIAEALRGVPNGSQCIVKDSDHPEKWAKELKAVRDKARNVRLAEAKDLCAKYSQEYSWDEPCRSLVEKMNELVFGGSGDTRNEKHKAPSSSNLYTVKKGKSQVSEQVSDPVPDPGNTRNKKPKAPCSSNLYTVKKGKSQVSEQASDPVPDAAASLQTFETKGWNSLHSAAESGNDAIIEILLSSGLDIDSRGNDCTTPLMVAAAAGKEETVNLLLTEGADPSLKGQDGWSLLHFAAQSGNVTIIDTMLSKGLNIDSRCETVGLTPLLVSLQNDRLEAAKHSIEKGANVSLKFKAEMNALSVAAFTGSVAAIKMLLSHGLYTDSRDADGNTPSLMAAMFGNTEALNYLLDQGADPLLQNNEELGLLHLAALSKNVATIEALLSRKFDINVRGSCVSLTPLLACLNKGDLETANYLLKRGADEHMKGKEGLTALSVAARSGNVAAIEMLVNRGHDPNSRDGCDKTPIMWAVESGNQAAVKYLLSLTHEGLLPTTD